MSSKNYLKDKNILITGGTGSIGSELLRQCLLHQPNVLRIISNDENSLFEAHVEFGHLSNVRILHGDIRDYERLEKSFDNIDIVFHAAAMKHVPICEYNPLEAIKTNIMGTENVIKAAIKSKVSKVLTISTDKAVNPTTTMGATKLMAEKITIDGNNYAGNSSLSFSCVRFGNVISSRGSVIPLFQKQIKNGGPVTVTDKDMTRFFMSIPEAVSLVLKSIEIMRGREIFILKSMSSVRIIDLAEVMIQEHLNRTNEKISIEFIGKRNSEKNLECLMTDIEMEIALENDEFYLISNSNNNQQYSDFTKPDEFTISSDRVPKLSKDQIRKIIF